MKDPLLNYNKFFQWIADLLYNPKKYFVFKPRHDRIGHLIYEIHIAISVAKKKRKVLVLFPHRRSVNKQIYSCNFNCKTLRRKGVRFYLLYYILFLVDLFDLLYNGFLNWGKRNISHYFNLLPKIAFNIRLGIEKGKWWRYRLKGTSYYFDFDLLASQAVDVSLNSKQLKIAEKNRDFLMVPQNAWIVCLHVRESGYLGKHSNHNHRDSNISNYYRTIKYITEKGGFVIRMGDSSMKKLPKMEKVIDYAHSKYNNDLMDLYWVSKCTFFLGCDSGPNTLAWLFNKPLCAVNYSDYNINVLYRDCEVVMPKHFFSKKHNRILSFEELILSNIHLEDPSNNNYILIENTSEEILNTVINFLTLLEKETLEEWDIPLQNKIKSTIREKFKLFLSDNSIDGGKKDKWGPALNNKGLFSNYYLQRCYEKNSYIEGLTKKFLLTSKSHN